MVSHHALFPLLVIPKPGLPLCISVCLCNHSTPMTKGQGEGKVKLHTMNLVAVRSPLTDMGFVRVSAQKVMCYP